MLNYFRSFERPSRRSSPKFGLTTNLALASTLLLSSLNVQPHTALAQQPPEPDHKEAHSAAGAQKSRRDSEKREPEKRGAPSFEEELAQRKLRLKRAMANFGVQDDAVQETIINHLRDEVIARRQTREQVRKLQRALRDKSTPDEEVRTAVNEMRAATESDRQRRLEFDKRLDEQINYSRNPRLEAMLLLFGVIGDGSMMVPFNASRPHREGNREGNRGNSSNEARERRRQLILKQYDTNKDGRLDESEKAVRDTEKSAKE